MIVLPTKQRLERRRTRLYDHLSSVLHTASVHQVEHIMRQIHIINMRLRTYFQREMREQKELFDKNEDDDIIETKDAPTLKDIAQIEGDIKKGKI